MFGNCNQTSRDPRSGGALDFKAMQSPNARIHLEICPGAAAVPNVVDFGAPVYDGFYGTQLRIIPSCSVRPGYSGEVTAGGQIWVHFTWTIVLSCILQINPLFFVSGTANESEQQCRQVLNRAV